MVRLGYLCPGVCVCASVSGSPEGRLGGSEGQSGLEVLQGLSALALQQEQPAHVHVVLPAVLTQRPGVQVLQQGPVQPALLVGNAELPILLPKNVCIALFYFFVSLS